MLHEEPPLNALSISTINSSKVGLKKWPPFGNSTTFACKFFANRLCTSAGTRWSLAPMKHTRNSVFSRIFSYSQGLSKYPLARSVASPKSSSYPATTHMPLTLYFSAYRAHATAPEECPMRTEFSSARNSSLTNGSQTDPRHCRERKRERE